LNEKDDGNKLLMALLLNISYYNQKIKYVEAPADPSEQNDPAPVEEPVKEEPVPTKEETPGYPIQFQLPI
jgi:hypothetical protein